MGVMVGMWGTAAAPQRDGGWGGTGCSPPARHLVYKTLPCPHGPIIQLPKENPNAESVQKGAKIKGNVPIKHLPPKKVWVWDALWGLTPPGVGLGADQPQRVDLGADPPPKMWVWGQTPTPGVGMG